MIKKRRIHASEPGRQNGSSNSQFPLLLCWRELGMRGPHKAAAAASAKQQLVESTLRLIRLQGGFDTHDGSAPALFPLSYMQQRSAVQDMAFHGGLLFVLLQSGLCPVYDVEGAQSRRVGYLNQSAAEVIRSLVLNSHDNSVVTVSCLTTDADVQLHCTTTPATARSFTAGAVFCTAGQPILEVVGNHGFLEFDDTCSRALVLNTNSKMYKVYDMTSGYRLLFTLPASGVIELKLGPQYLIVVQKGREARCPGAQGTATRSSKRVQLGGVQANEHSIGSGAALQLVVYAAINGQVVAQHDLQLPDGVRSTASAFDVLELCGDKLLLKVPLCPFEVYEVHTMRLCGSSTNEQLSQISVFIDLQPRHMFMTICGHTLTTYNFKARSLTRFEDHELWYPATQQDNTVYITERWVASLCRTKGSASRLPAAGEPGAIHVSNLDDGRLLASLTAFPPAMFSGCDKAHHGTCGNLPSPSAFHTSVAAPGQHQLCTDSLDRGDNPSAEALTGVTALLLVPGINHVYAGTQQGKVHVWAPGQLVTCNASSLPL